MATKSESVVESPKPEAPKSAAPIVPPPRRSAVRDIEHKAVPETSRAVKEKLAAKLDDTKFDNAMKQAGASASDEPKEEGGKRIRHRVQRTARTPDSKPGAAPEVEKKPDPTESSASTTDSTTTITDTAPTADKVPDEIRRSLKNYNHTDEEIDAEFKRDPEGFMRHAKFVHATRQKEIEAYSRMGQQQLPPAVSQALQQPVVAQGGDFQSDLQEIEKFEKLYPNDPAAKFMAKQARDNLNYRVQQHQVHSSAVMASTQQAVDGFFSQESMKPYTEHYKDAAKRNKVIETAAAIINGGRIQGRNFSLNDALIMAHDATASPVMKAAARKEITDEVAKRNAALTQRNQVGAPDAATPGDDSKKKKTALSRQEIVNRAGERLKKIRM
jgi:hypothetical protein